MSETSERIANSGARIVGIDGAPYAGKTHLARELGELLDAVILRFDDYIPDDPAGRFFDYMDADSLRRDLDSALSSNQVVVIEGICLREVLGRVSIRPDRVVYVRNLSPDSDWVNSDISRLEYEAIVAEEEGIGRYIQNDDGESLRKDNAWYHMNYKPVATADEIVEHNGSL